MRLLFFTFTALAIVFLGIVGFHHLTRGEGPGHLSSSGFAVVELFTSEGCSSCPAADKILGRIQKEYQSGVYVLGFHVDYWDRLGWRDVYSDASYTKRQGAYASVFSLNSIYTPQVVVNGRFQFVGSDEGQLRKTIDKELDRVASGSIDGTASVGPNKEIELSYEVTTKMDEWLQIALVQLNATTKVEAGENKGRVLQHINLVRNLRTIEVGERNGNKGSLVLSIPPDLIDSDFEIIAFMQKKKTLEIESAMKFPIR